MRVKIHVKGIKGDGAISPGEEPTALFHGVLEVDGHLLEEVGEIEVSFSGDGFVQVTPHLIPGFFEVVVHDKDAWNLLLNRCDQERRVETGTSRLLAAVEAED